MKLAFSTLGCPGWSLEQVIAAAKRYGFEGVELRGIAGELDIRRLPDFSGDGVVRSRALFEAAGIDIVSVDSSSRLFQVEANELRSSIGEAEEYVALAGRIKAPLVRVFGGYIPEDVTLDEAVARFAHNLRQLGDLAQKMGVVVASETHDSFLTGRVLSEVMKQTDHESVGVVWDVSNCYWTGEPIERTAALLAPFLKLVHIKDSVFDGRQAHLRFIGDGDVPIRDVLMILSDLGYDGYLSYEWEKVWQPDLPEPEEAFPQYIEMMREYMG
ncbi:MAG: sugar phosphate isomerase/epimerase [Phycisphaerales bacterium]|nr:sugar phosphate isomerase/epimerase [Phycisphaerales bacterium]